MHNKKTHILKKRTLHKLFEEALAEQSCAWDLSTKKITGLHFLKNSHVTTPMEYLHLTVYPYDHFMLQMLVPWNLVCEEIIQMDTCFTQFIKKANDSLLNWIKMLRDNNHTIVLYDSKLKMCFAIPKYVNIKKISNCVSL